MRRASAVPARAGRGEAGFTMVELMITLTVFAIVIAGAMGYYQTQNRAFAVGTERASASQNLLYTTSGLERDLAAAGTNLAPGQPFLIYGDANAIAINADLISMVPDPFAVYHDPDATVATAAGVARAQRYTLPGTSVVYPDTTYRGSGGAVTGAETIQFFFTPDTATQRTDDFSLYRQVNGAAPELVARRLVALGSEPFFTYVKLSAPASNAAGLVDVAAGSLPVRHVAPLHGSPADTGRSAVADSVRGVRVAFGTLTGTGRDEGVQSTRRVIWMPNAGLPTPRTCGGDPLFGGTLSATIDNSSGSPAVALAWPAATDETGGERDVIRYVVYRYPTGTPRPPEPYLSFPAGNASYQYVDRTVASGDRWTYAVAAQDCTPSLSTPTGTTIVVP